VVLWQAEYVKFNDIGRYKKQGLSDFLPLIPLSVREEKWQVLVLT
jgi:hypothetical protein